MQRNKFDGSILVVTVCVLLLSACSVADKAAPGRKKVDYKKSKTIQSLEVPPDLSSNTINDAPASIDAAGTTYSEFGATLPEGGGSTE